MALQRRFGFPIVNAANIFDVLADLGIRRSTMVEDAVPLDAYKAREGLSQTARDEAARYAPKAEVMLQTQSNGKPFTGFRSVGKNWATTFVMLPGRLVAVVGEYKHGCDQVTLVPPSGTLSKADNGLMANCAWRETSEELGIQLKTVVPLGCSYGFPISGRQSTVRYYPFLGVLPDTFTVAPSTLDASEYLKIVLVPLADWLHLVDHGETNELCAGDVTYRALHQLGLVTRLI